MAYAGKLTYKTELDTSGVEKSGSTIKSIIAGLGITKMISMAMSEITNSIDGAIARYDTLQNFPKVMSNLGIASEDAQKSIDKMSDKLSGLPTTLDQGAMAVQRFTSANNDVEKSTDIFLAFNNAVLAGGANAQIQSNALEQMSQAYSKGKMDMMEWRTLQMAMPAQLNQVAKAMGVTTDELGEMLREGDNTRESMDQFMNTIVQLNTTGLDGFQNFEEQARNATGGINTAIVVAKTQIVKGVTDIIDGINKGLEDANLPSISEIIASIGKKAKELLDGIAEKLPDIIEFLVNLYNAIEPILPILEAVGAGILAIVTAYTLYQKIVTIVTAVQTALNFVLAMNPIGLIVLAIIGLIAIIVVLWNKCEWFRDAIKGLWELIKTGFQLAIDYIKSWVEGIINTIVTIVQTGIAIYNWFAELPTKMLNIGMDIVRGIGNGITNGYKWLKNKIKEFVGNVTDFLKKMFKIGSPSKLMADEIGQYLPEGIAVGIEANTDSVEDAMNDMYKEINKTIKLENSKLSFDVVSGNVYTKATMQTPVTIDVNSTVEMDGQKVGRIVTPTVTRTIKNGGGI